MGRRTGTLGLFSRAITQQPYGSTAIHQTRLPVSGWPWTGLDIASAPVVHVGEEGGGQKGGQDTATRQPRPRREETWNAVVQSLPHRTFGTNPQRRGQKITLRLADEDRRGSVQLWRRGCAVDQTHTTPPLSASSSPPPLSAAFPCGVGRSGLDSWWEEIGRAQYRKQKEQIRCCYESLPGRLCRVAVYAVVVLFRDAGGIMWPSPGGVRRTRGRPPVAGTRFSVPSPVGLQQPTFQHRRAVSHPSGPLSSTTKVPLPAKAPSPCRGLA